MNPGLLAVAIWTLGAVVMTGAWLLSMRVRNAGYVDVAWAALLAGAAVAAGALSEGAAVPRVLVALLGGAWGLRLAAHLFRRVCSEPEDGRYLALREKWRGSGWKYFLFFQLQAFVAAVFALPFLGAAASQREGFSAWSLVAIFIWLLAVGGESLADAQLAAFRRAPAHHGKTCRVGLWTWSRHPNYFCEWLHWFAYVLLAVGSPYAWLAWLGPVLMLVFLYRVSGIPWAEAQALRSRGDDYRRYQRDVSAFFPRPPRHPSP